MRRHHALLLAGSLAAIALTLIGGVRHDYIYYLEQWRLVLAGADPWSTNNAYGPLHNAFALLLPLHELAPKLAQTLLLLAANVLIVRRLALTQAPWANYLIAVGANALVWIAVFWLGNNDGLVAACLLAAVAARLDRHMLLAGLVLGLAALDKYYPLLLIPFFALDARRIDGKLLLASIGTFAAGMGIGTLLWGRAMLEAVVFGVSRDATVLSVFHALSVIGRANGWGDAADLLIRLNSLLVIATWTGALILAWVRRDDWLVAATWGLFAVLLVHKVGHQQFWVSWLALVACLPLLQSDSATRLARLSWPFALFLALFQLGFVLLAPEYFRGPLAWIKDYAGLVAFPLGAMQLVLFLRPASRPQP